MTPEKEFLQNIKENQNLIHNVCETYAATLERDDLVQEIIMSAWVGFNRFRRDCKFSTWLYTVCRFVCIDRLRKEASRKNRLQGYRDKMLAIHETKSQLAKRIKQEKVYESVISTLPGDDYKILQMYFEGMDYRTMEAATGLTETNLRVKISRIKIRIQRSCERNLF